MHRALRLFFALLVVLPCLFAQFGGDSRYFIGY